MRSKFFILIMLVSFFLPFTYAGCNGGGGDSDSGEGNGNVGPGWVTIDQDSFYTTKYESTYLSGDAFISPTRWGCCTGSASDTGVTVTYTNSDTGISGGANQRAEYCWFFRPYLCGHRWSSSVALQMGENNITITATDGYNEGKDSIKVTRIPETTPPTISSTIPDSGADNVSVNITINATFSEEMDPSTINASSFTLVDASDNPVGGWVTYSNKIATFKPYADLDYSTSHIATITAAVTDLSGNRMAADYTWSFNTGSAPDTTPPAVITTIPASRAECVNKNISINATFNEDIDAFTINTSSFIVVDESGNSVSGYITYSNRTATFRPNNHLAYSTTYISTITTEVTDISGNHMAVDYIWDFTTNSPPEGFWQSMSDTQIPLGSGGHTAVWTGTEMIVWGGRNDPGLRYNTGGKYNPVTDTWLSTTTTNAPSGRDRHTAVWTGNEMIIWGGDYIYTGVPSTGGRYDPTIDAWLPISTTDSPLARDSHTAVWTGTEMIIWGGRDWNSKNTNTGRKYDPVTDTWLPISIVNAPSASSGHTAAWTGTEMFVWHGRTKTGGKYDPVTDTWQPVTSDCAPIGNYFVSVWTGSKVIIWGAGGSLTDPGIGGIYNPYTDTWLETPYIAAPEAHSATVIWTGGEMIVWNGNEYSRFFNSGGIYKP